MAHKNKNLLTLYIYGGRLNLTHQSAQGTRRIRSFVHAAQKKALPNLDRIVEIYGRGIPGEQGRQGKKLRTLTWKFTTGVGKALVPQMTNKLAQFVRRRHRINNDFAYEIKNLEANKLVKYSQLSRITKITAAFGFLNYRK